MYGHAESVLRLIREQQEVVNVEGHRVLVSGWREYTNQEVVNGVLDGLHAARRIDMLIHGAARGVDTLAERWAISRGVGMERYPVKKEDWARLGKGAGNVRNQEMLDVGKPTLVVCFVAAESKGTRDMMERAVKAKVPVHYVSL